MAAPCSASSALPAAAPSSCAAPSKNANQKEENLAIVAITAQFLAERPSFVTEIQDYRQRQFVQTHKIPDDYKVSTPEVTATCGLLIQVTTLYKFYTQKHPAIPVQQRMDVILSVLRKFQSDALLTFISNSIDTCPIYVYESTNPALNTIANIYIALCKSFQWAASASSSTPQQPYPPIPW
jgi:hypothetical protein